MAAAKSKHARIQELESFLDRLALEPAGRSGHYIGQVGRTVVVMEIALNSRDSTIVQLYVHLWSPCLTMGAAPENKRSLVQSVITDGIHERDMLAEVSRRLSLSSASWSEDLRSVEHAIEEKLLPFLEAIRSFEDLRIVFALGDESRSERQRLRVLSRKNAARIFEDGNVEGIKLPPVGGSYVARRKGTLVDAWRFASAVATHPLGAALASADFLPLGRPGLLPLNHLQYGRKRCDFVDIIDVNLSEYGAATSIAFFSWVPEMDGLSSRSVSGVPDGFRPSCPVAMWIGEAGIVPTLTSHDLFDDERRQVAMSSIARAFPEADSYMRSRITIHDVLARPRVDATSRLQPGLVVSQGIILDRWAHGVAEAYMKNSRL